MSATSALAVRYEADGIEISLSPSIVVNYLMGGSREAQCIDQDEMARVIMTCQARGLNPFTDVAIQPRRDKSGKVKCSIVELKDFMLRRAHSHPRFKGMKAGVIVVNGAGGLTRREGSAVYAELGERLVAGWAAVYVDGFDHPSYDECTLSEYSTGRAMWRSPEQGGKPATMIRKVAISHAVREAFPSWFNGVYSPEEMGMDEEPAAPVEPPVVGGAYEVPDEPPYEDEPAPPFAQTDEYRQIYEGAPQERPAVERTVF